MQMLFLGNTIVYMSNITVNVYQCHSQRGWPELGYAKTRVWSYGLTWFCFHCLCVCSITPLYGLCKPCWQIIKYNQIAYLAGKKLWPIAKLVIGYLRWAIRFSNDSYTDSPINTQYAGHYWPSFLCFGFRGVVVFLPKLLSISNFRTNW